MKLYGLRPLAHKLMSVPRVEKSANPDPWRTLWMTERGLSTQDHCSWRDAINHALQLSGGA